MNFEKVERANMDGKLRLFVYRHKYCKDIYLARNWSICGGSPNTDFYYATKDVITALKDAVRSDFIFWSRNFLDESGKTELKAIIVDSKEVDIDGYKGTITKRLEFSVADFEKISLVEAET